MNRIRQEYRIWVQGYIQRDKPVSWGAGAMIILIRLTVAGNDKKRLRRNFLPVRPGPLIPGWGFRKTDGAEHHRLSSFLYCWFVPEYSRTWIFIPARIHPDDTQGLPENSMALYHTHPNHRRVWDYPRRTEVLHS